MKVVLMEKINTLGDLGDVVQVKAGYARNYLVPYRKACYATADNITLAEERRAKILQAEQQQLYDAQQCQQKLQGAMITVAARVSSSKRLFGSVAAAEIMEAIKRDYGVDLYKKEIMSAANVPIKELGEHQVTIHLYADIYVDVIVRVVAELT